jgi:hypothetical protein
VRVLVDGVFQKKAAKSGSEVFSGARTRLRPPSVSVSPNPRKLACSTLRVAPDPAMENRQHLIA